MLTNKQAVSEIRKAFNKTMFKKVEDFIEWYVDKETPTSYSWDFEYDGQRVEFKCDRETGDVEVLF